MPDTQPCRRARALARKHWRLDVTWSVYRPPERGKGWARVAADDPMTVTLIAAGQWHDLHTAGIPSVPGYHSMRFAEQLAALLNSPTRPEATGDEAKGTPRLSESV